MKSFRSTSLQLGQSILPSSLSYSIDPVSQERLQLLNVAAEPAASDDDGVQAGKTCAPIPECVEVQAELEDVRFRIPDDEGEYLQCRSVQLSDQFAEVNVGDASQG
jgi:hypothetical protein